jgi:hypothetical protein
MSAQSRSSFFAPAVIIAVLVFSFFYPRLVIGIFGEHNQWTSYFYQYGFGLVTFIIGTLVVMPYRSHLKWRGREFLYWKLLLAGLIFFAAGHAFWILFALNTTYKGV